MNEYKAKFESLESVILAIIMSIFLLFSIYYFNILLLIGPVPFIIYGVKSDLKSGILSLIASLLTLGAIGDISMAITLAAIYIPFTTLNIYLIKKRHKATKIIIYSAVVLVITEMLVYSILSMQGVNIIVTLQENFSHSLELQMESLQESGLTSYELLEERDFLQSTFQEGLMILPSIMIVFMLIISFINYSLTSYGLKRIGINISNLPKLAHFRLPNNFAIGTLIMILTGFILKWMNVDYGNAIYINIMVVLGSILVVQGLAVVDYFLTIKLRAKNFLRFAVYIFIFLTPQILMTLSILGSVDVIFDLRKLKRG